MKVSTSSLWWVSVIQEHYLVFTNIRDSLVTLGQAERRVDSLSVWTALGLLIASAIDACPIGRELLCFPTHLR